MPKDSAVRRVQCGRGSIEPMDDSTRVTSAFERRFILVFVTGAGAGYFPYCPGTLGTLVAIPLSFGVNRLAASSPMLALLILIASVFCAISLSGRGAEILRQQDPRVIVIDEITGFLVANFLAPPGLWALTLAFVFFRFFDIAKVFPIASLEKLPGGRGIVMDDVMAGLYTLASIRVISWLGIL
jgi:phosphatidylglycerophosphatase A